MGHPMEFMGQLTHMHASLGGRGTETEITTIFTVNIWWKHKQWHVAIGLLQLEESISYRWKNLLQFSLAAWC